MTDLHTMNDAAKLLAVGQNKLFRFLRDHKLLNEHNLPYQQYIDAGYFRVVQKSFDHPSMGQRIYGKTHVTNKGLSYLEGLLQSADAA